MFEEEENAKKKRAFEIGGDLSTLSLGDLDERVEILQREIERLRAEHTRKSASLNAADAFFKR